MKAYYFRRKDCDRSMYIGLAVAANLKQLFWTIDEHDDPYGYEFAPATIGDAIVVRAFDVSQETAIDASGDTGAADFTPFEYLSVDCDRSEPDADGYRVEASESMKCETDRKWRTFGPNFSPV
jgi:hypothetical protein